MLSTWVPFDEFLALVPSKGRREAAAPHSEYSSHEAGDLDVKFMLTLIRERHDLAKCVCVPDFVFCCELPPRHSRRSCAPHRLVRAGVALVGRRMYLPRDLRKIVRSCKQRFVMLNLGLYEATSNLGHGHANAVLIDVRLKIVERFEPMGAEVDEGSDAHIRRAFEKALPGYEYIGSEHAPAVGPQTVADAHGGLCVTWCIAFVLIRLLNPNRSYRDICNYLAHGPPTQLRRRILRLNRYVVDRLRAYERGTL